MSSLVNLVKALLDSMFVLWKQRNRVFEFDYQQMNTLELVQCSKNDIRIRSMFDKLDSDWFYEDIIPLILDVKVKFNKWICKTKVFLKKKIKVVNSCVYMGYFTL